MPRKPHVDQTSMQAFQQMMKSPVMKNPHEGLRAGSEGVIFRNKRGAPIEVLKEMQAILEIFSMGMGQMLAKGAKVKGKPPVLQFSELLFPGEAESHDMHVYVCDRNGKRWPTMADGAFLFYQIHIMQSIEEFNRFPFWIHSIIPFETCCLAKMKDVQSTTQTFVADAVSAIKKRDGREMHPYDCQVEIHNNGILELEKENIVKGLQEQIERFSDVLVFDRNFDRTLTDKNRPSDKTVLFKIVVLGENAYFSVLYASHIAYGYEFVKI